jgi:hypothetical protein
MTTSEAGACAAGALAESSHQARADLLANQLKVAEAFRQSLESELRDLRFKAAGLQTQVLTLQTKLERSVEAQVDELNQIEKLRKGAGSTDSRGYEEALAQLAMLKKKLETSEADRIGEATHTDCRRVQPLLSLHCTAPGCDKLMLGHHQTAERSSKQQSHPCVVSHQRCKLHPSPTCLLTS